MTDTNTLRLLVKNAGLKFAYIAKQMDLTPYGLQNKIDNRTEFKASEIAKLCKILSIDQNQKESVFFANNVE